MPPDYRKCWLKLAVIVLSVVAGADRVTAVEPVELKKAGNDNYRLMAGKKELAVLMPNAWQGNLNILSTQNKTVCGVSWPHFLLHSEGKWLTDRVESEGLNLVEFKTLSTSGLMRLSKCAAMVSSSSLHLSDFSHRDRSSSNEEA